jgi:hypothetical protein
MSSRPLLTGQQEYVDDPIDPTLRKLEAENRRLDEALRMERLKTGQIEAGVRALKSQLTPLYRALQAVFGEIDAMGIEATSDVRPASSHATAAWELWKQKLPGFPSRMIDALLKHGELSVAQLVVAAQCPRKQTIYDAASKLQKLNLINSNGGKYSLKEL